MGSQSLGIPISLKININYNCIKHLININIVSFCIDYNISINNAKNNTGELRKYTLSIIIVCMSYAYHSGTLSHMQYTVYIFYIINHNNNCQNDVIFTYNLQTYIENNI